MLKSSFEGLRSFPLSVLRSELIMTPVESGGFGHVNVDVFSPNFIGRIVSGRLHNLTAYNYFQSC